MIKHRIALLPFFSALSLFALLLTFSSGNALAQSKGDLPYTAKYTGAASLSASSCGVTGTPQVQAKQLLTTSINVNLDILSDKITSRLDDMAYDVTRAIAYSSTALTNAMETHKVEFKKAQEAALTLEQQQIANTKTLEAEQALKPSDPEVDMLAGMIKYRPELPVAFRQAEMQRYISELNNVPLPNKYRDAATGQPLSGYVDTSMGKVAALGQEFRNFVKLFCDARSIRGKLAATIFVTGQPPQSNYEEYWCGQDRGLTAPGVSKVDGRYIPLEDNALASHVTNQVNAEAGRALAGNSKINLVNAPKNVAEIYFEPRSLTVADQDLYQKAEQEFARFVIGRADDISYASQFDEGPGQRQFLDAQARIAKLALARYPFAEMFSQKVPTMPAGSAAWAADLIEANLGQCSSASPNYPEYKSLCDLTAQLRAKSQISESEFYDVLFSRQFQGMAFGNKLLKMTPGQTKRLQANLMGLQLALNYQRNRMKEQQLALMAAIYAQQNR